jgi:hypothetical protein
VQGGVGVDRVLYLYCVIPRDQGFPSDAGVALEGVSYAAVAAVVEPVCAREFSSPVLDEKLQSLEWVARQARKHETVLEQAMRHGPIVPARLCTLFSNAEALKRSLADNEGRFLAALERIQGREEWGLKAFCDEHRLRVAAADDQDLRTLDAAIALSDPGHAFVLRKKREARLAELTSLRLDELVDEVLGAVEQVADDVSLRPVLPASATGRNEPMALNAAALVSVSTREAFQATIAELSVRYQEDGLVMEMSGPWPPYSFCDDEDDGAGAEEGD